jgi:hypothetical protein
MTNLIASIQKRLKRFSWSRGVEAIRGVDTKPAALTMLFPDESAALRQFAMMDYTGEGEIVDLGAWAGSSTLAMAQGLAINGDVDLSRKRIHAYDIFIWEQWMSDIQWNSSLVDGYKPGDSFLPLYEQQISQYAHLIETYPGDLNAMAEFPRKIEYLFVDVMKTFELANSSLRKFFTQLIPGKSVVHHQDYNHYFTPWIHLLMYRFRSCFELRQYVHGTPSTIFNYIAPLPRQQCLQTYGFESFGKDEFEAAFEYSLSITGKVAWPSIESARVMAFIHQGRWEEAEAEYGQLRAKYPGKNYDVNQIETILKTREFR